MRPLLRFGLGATFGCGKALDEPAPDLRALCQDQWDRGEDLCQGGCGDPVMDVWAEGYRQHLTGAWGVPRSVVDEHLTVLNVDITSSEQDNAKVSVFVQSEWVVLPYWLGATSEVVPVTVASVKEAFDQYDRYPRLDITDPPRPWSEIDDFLARCGQHYGVTITRKLCSSSLALDEQLGQPYIASYSVTANYPGASPPKFVQAHVNPWGESEDGCDLREYD